MAETMQLQQLWGVVDICIHGQQSTAPADLRLPPYHYHALPSKGFRWPEGLLLLARQSHCNWGGSRVKWGDTEANWHPSSIQTTVGCILPWNPKGHPPSLVPLLECVKLAVLGTLQMLDLSLNILDLTLKMLDLTL